MSERGVFAVDRGIWDHPSFANEAFTEREAWQWLIGEASFKHRTKRVGSVVIKLDRGQVAASTRFMSDKWQWSEPRVRRFLKRLKIDAMIDAATDAGITVITICNYNKYQRVSLPRDAEIDALNDAAATQQRRKVEGTENKEEVVVVVVSEPAPENSERGKSLISPQAFEVSTQVLIAMGLDPAHPLSVGAPLTVQGWFNVGLHPDHIMTGVRRAMARRGRDPPSTLSYFEKPILRAKADLSPNMPILEASDVQPGSDQSSVHVLRPAPSRGSGYGQLRAELRARRPQPTG